MRTAILADSIRLLLKTVRELTDIKELTPTLVNSLIERIEVHNNDKYDRHGHVKVDIYFTVAGMMSIPAERSQISETRILTTNEERFALIYREHTNPSKNILMTVGA
ncbi:MAG: DUF4368 domain-containing protein [Clostridia bacterium]|nr:DUF4368 domain-containing protein [Clostridia bacterium]